MSCMVSVVFSDLILRLYGYPPRHRHCTIGTGSMVNKNVNLQYKRMWESQRLKNKICPILDKVAVIVWKKRI